MASTAVQSSDEEWNELVNNLTACAIFQGRFSYLIMSFHAVNPRILDLVFDADPAPYLFANMVYGITVMICSRRSFSVIAPLTRFSLSLMASLAFNYSTMICYGWLCKYACERPILGTFLGYLSGRVMMVHLLAFLYHCDSRTNVPGSPPPRDAAFEGMHYHLFFINIAVA